MIYGSFIHGDDNIFRTSVSEFVNDSNTHPIVKYKAFIALFLLVLSGIIILGMIHGKNMFNHRSWWHLFIPVSDNRVKYGINGGGRDGGDGGDDVFNYNYVGQSNHKSGAAIFREAIEGFDVKKLPPVPKVVNGKVVDKKGGYVKADVKGAKKAAASDKTTPCGTDCGQYLDIKGQLVVLNKIVDQVNEQKENIAKTDTDLQSLGKQIEDLNKSLSPGGQLDIKM